MIPLRFISNELMKLSYPKISYVCMYVCSTFVCVVIFKSMYAGYLLSQVYLEDICFCLLWYEYLQDSKFTRSILTVFSRYVPFIEPDESAIQSKPLQ